MSILDIISKKRQGLELTEAEIRYFIRHLVSDEAKDYQTAAWLMAVAIQGMTITETTHLTLAMAESGDTLVPESAGTGLVVDKHSTGGVGDKTTITLAPLAASLGLPVAKVSGRGLGFSGGTVDKLESIEGWSGNLSGDQFQRQLQEVGCVVSGQSHNLVPADRILYHLRDVTGTVTSLPLVVSSIMSKKIATGAPAILLDVKTGSGAFCRTVAEARELGRIMVAIGRNLGRDVQAWITQMDQPLGHNVGNALEVREAIATLQGAGPPDFTALISAMAAHMLLMGRRVSCQAAAERQVAEALQQGRGLAVLRAMVAWQGGNPAWIDNPDLLPQAPVQIPAVAPVQGYIQRMHTDEIGLAVLDLGAGRTHKEDVIDPAVGLVMHRKTGTWVEKGDAICTVHARTDKAAQIAGDRIVRATEIGAAPVAALPIILEKLA